MSSTDHRYAYALMKNRLRVNSEYLMGQRVIDDLSIYSKFW